MRLRSLSGAAAEAFSIADQTAHDYGAHSGLQLMKHVYAMRVPVFDMGGQFLSMRKLRVGVDILRPTEQPELAEPAAGLEELLEDLRAEFALPPRSLDPATPEVQERTMGAIQRAIRELTH